MVHVTNLHLFERRSAYPFPAPEANPGLVGDIVNGVGDVASDALNGVVGLVTTALSDVQALVAPPKTSSTSTSPRVTTTAAAATSSPNTPAAATTPASPDSTTPAPSGGNNGGSSGKGENSGGSDSGGNSGSSDGDGSTDNGGSAGKGGSAGNGGSADNGGSSTDSGSGSSINSAASSNGLPATVVSLVNEGGSTASSQSGSGVPSSSGVLDIASSIAAPSGSLVTTSPVINAVGSTNSDNNNSPSVNSVYSSVQGPTKSPTTVRGTGIPGSTGSSNPGSASDGGVDGNGASTSNNHGLSAGVIAAIVVISSIALLVSIVFIMRKWYRKRRARRFQTWASRPGRFTFFGGAAPANMNKQADENPAGRSGSGSDTRSVRSSFGTTYDLGHSPDPFAEPSASNFSDFYTTPNASHLALTPSPQPAIVTPMIQRPQNAVGRQSLISIVSSDSSSHDNGSGSGSGHGGNATRNANASSTAVEEARENSNDLHAQYLIVPESHGQQDSLNRPQLSPITVRPWSPTERWAFPKPPTSTVTSAQKTIFYERPTSPIVSESAHIEHMPVTNLPPLPSLAPPTQQHDPFVDPSHVKREAHASSAAVVAAEGAVTAQTSASHTEGVVGAVEYIRRPFVPTLTDELRVHQGDVIRVLQAFDDGWVQIEKLSSAADTIAAATSNLKTSPEPERGLIPVDCLREAGEPLPTFLASRRVSSYYGGGVAL